jgi:hypothetical protein
MDKHSNFFKAPFVQQKINALARCQLPVLMPILYLGESTSVCRFFSQLL